MSYIFRNEDKVITFRGEGQPGASGIITFGKTDFINGGTINFNGNSIASLAMHHGEEGKDIENPLVEFKNSGMMIFNDRSSAGNAKIVNTGQVIFKDNSSAGGRDAFIINSKTLTFEGDSSAGVAVIRTEKGGKTFFRGSANGGNAALDIVPGGEVDFTGLTSGGTTVGTITGCASGPTAPPAS